MKQKILIIEDERDIVEVIEYNLKKAGYATSSVSNGKKAQETVLKEKPDLIILDLMLPGLTGFEVCKQLKAQRKTQRTPIIILSARSQETDKVEGLELGADDYMTKPFSPRELIARAKAVLRRGRPGIEKDKKPASKITIDKEKHQVKIAGSEVSLTLTEFKLLAHMVFRPGIVLSRENLLNSVFGYESAVYDRTVDAHIKSLRKKMGPLKDSIETVRGVGYRFREV